MGRLRVGVDIVDAAQVRASIAEFGQVYLDRVFTAHEQSCATGDDTVRARALAARFAAKEAAIKVLRPGPDDHVPWTSVEVVRDPGGWCEIKLWSTSQLLADRGELTDIAVSLSHDGDRATAVVVAMCGEGAHDRRDHP